MVFYYAKGLRKALLDQIVNWQGLFWRNAEHTITESIKLFQQESKSKSKGKIENKNETIRNDEWMNSH